MRLKSVPVLGAFAFAAAAGLALGGCSKSSDSNKKTGSVEAQDKAAPRAATGSTPTTVGEGAERAAAALAHAEVAKLAHSAKQGEDRPGAAVLTSAVASAKPVGKPTGIPERASGDKPTPQGTKVIASDHSYELHLKVPASAAMGAEGRIEVQVVPKSGWKMNHEFPTQLEVTPPEGVTIAKPKQKIADAERFEDAGALFAVVFKATSAGDKAFQGKFKFAVCTEESCVPKRQKLSFKVAVK